MNINAVSRYAMPANNGQNINFGNINPIVAKTSALNLDATQKANKKGLFAGIKNGAHNLIQNAALLLASIGYNIVKVWAKITGLAEGVKDKVCGLFRKK